MSTGETTEVPPPPPVGTMMNSFSHNGPGRLDIIVESILLFVCLVTFGLRLWSRRLQRSNLQINDWLILLAVPLMTARYALEAVAILKCGLGLHVGEVSVIGGPDVLILFTKVWDGSGYSISISVAGTNMSSSSSTRPISCG